MTAPVFFITGANGQVGFELVRALQSVGRVVAPTHDELDLAHPERLAAALRRARPAVVLNAAAYTAVDRAESERDHCFAVNADAPGVMAREARQLGALFVHYSTDYVFDGACTRPYLESDEPRPLNVYGESKLAGEREVAAAGGAWIVLRTSWVYGMRGKNFLRTMLEKAATVPELRVVDDQIGAPTWSRSIAGATQHIVSRALEEETPYDALAAKAGVYHLSSAGETSWCGFAQAIVEHAERASGRTLARVVPIKTAEWPAPAARPRWSVLDSGRAASVFGVRLPDWRSALADALRAG